MQSEPLAGGREARKNTRMPKPRVAVVLLLGWLAGCAAPEGEPPAPPAAEAARVVAPAESPPLPSAPARIVDAHGIDVSHHSGSVDWDAVAEGGYVFAFLKATEGVDAPDPMFDSHWQALADHDIHRGAYHFYVTEDDPEEQARFFLSRVNLEPGDLAPMVDIELLGHGTRGSLAPRLHRFLEIVEGAVGVAPIIYTSPNFWAAHLDDSFSRYPLWIAEYEVDEPTIPSGWSSWTLWQFEGDAPIVGVEKEADASRLHPDLDLLSLRIRRPPLPSCCNEPVIGVLPFGLSPSTVVLSESLSNGPSGTTVSMSPQSPSERWPYATRRTPVSSSRSSISPPTTRCAITILFPPPI
jgi:lysozyme